MVVQERINVRETVVRKNNCKLNFFSMYFVQNKEIFLSFKNSGTSFKERFFQTVESSCGSFKPQV